MNLVLRDFFVREKPWRRGRRKTLGRMGTTVDSDFRSRLGG